MSLIGFHRLLIAAGILFCFGFAAWQLVYWWVVGGWAALLLGVVFLGLGLGLTIYLSRLNRFLGIEERRPPHTRGDEGR